MQRHDVALPVFEANSTRFSTKDPLSTANELLHHHHHHQVDDVKRPVSPQWKPSHTGQTRRQLKVVLPMMHSVKPSPCTLALVSQTLKFLLNASENQLLHPNPGCANQVSLLP